MRRANRIWAAACGGAVVVTVAGGYFLGIQPAMAEADQATSAALATDGQTSAVQGRIAALSRAAAKEAELESRSVVLSKAVPSALQANTFIRRVNEIAALDGVAVQSVAVGTATAYAPPVSTPVAAAPAASASASASPSPSATPAAVAAPATPTAPVLAATDPSITAADFTVIPMIVTVNGTSAAGLQFIKDLQGDERLFLISGYTSTPSEQDASSVAFTLTGSIYALKG